MIPLDQIRSVIETLMAFDAVAKSRPVDIS